MRRERLSIRTVRLDRQLYFQYPVHSSTFIYFSFIRLYIAILSFPKPVVDLYLFLFLPSPLSLSLLSSSHVHAPLTRKKYRFGASEPVISIDPIGPKCYVFGMESVEWIDVGGNDIKYIRMAGDDENLCLGTVSFRNGYPVLHSLLFFFLFFLLFLSFQI